MKPSSANIKKYLQQHHFFGKNRSIQKIRFLGGGNHDNYHVQTNKEDCVVRVSKQDGLGAGVLFDIPDEFTLLKLLETYRVAPKAIAIDLERFGAPLLIEEYIDGTPYTAFKQLSDQNLAAVIDLMVKIHRIPLNEREFPFRFSYSYYTTSIRAWHKRLDAIQQLGKGKKLVQDFVREARTIIKKASTILLANQSVLDKTKKVFIYNDVHAGNLFWLPKHKKALFIDWQKVSIGDPAFMLAVFALAFENKVDEEREEFFEKLIVLYEKKSGTKNLTKLFWLRILEREVANMLWVVWAALKQKKKLPFTHVANYERYTRTRQCIDTFPYA